MGEPPSAKPLRDSGEPKELLRTSGGARQIERRLFLKQGLSLGALTLLTGATSPIPARCRACSTAFRDGTTAPRP